MPASSTREATKRSKKSKKASKTSRSKASSKKKAARRAPRYTPIEGTVVQVSPIQGKGLFAARAFRDRRVTL